MKLIYVLFMILCIVLITGCLVTEEPETGRVQDVEKEKAAEAEDKIMLPSPGEKEKVIVVQEPVKEPEPAPEPDIVVIDEPAPEPEKEVVEIAEEPEEDSEKPLPAAQTELAEFDAVEYTRAKGGSPTQILAGKSVLKPHLIDTIYTNNVVDSRGEFRMSVVDTTDKDSDLSGDRVEDVFIEFRSKQGNQFYIQEIRTGRKGIKFPHFGGIGLNKLVYGDTGIDTELNPQTLAYITVWGKTDLYKNGHFFAADVPVHVSVVQGFRDDVSHNITAVDAASTEAHIVIPGIYGIEEKTVIDGLPDQFLHVYFEDVSLFKE
ncbi:hypothetical protein GF371_04125 [Candidatus Woesearchaeota archaeon]|nr:hypothetical protein [Candidatus Woesearchaeota archaeon]